MADLQIKRNDLLPAVTIVCRDSIGPVDLNGSTASFSMINVTTGQAKISNVAATIVADPSCTADPTLNTLTANAHGLSEGDDVTVKSTGALPGGLDSHTRYYVINATTNTLQLALHPNGSAVDLTSAGSGTHTLLAGKVKYEWAGNDTDTAGTYFVEVQTIQGGKQLSYPNDRHLVVEVISDLV